MRQFFRSLRFKVIVSVVAVVLLIAAIVGSLDGSGAPQTSVIGGITLPIEKLSTKVTNKVSNFFGVFSRADLLQKQNDKLKLQNEQLSSQLINDQKLNDENKFLKGFLAIKTADPSIKMQPAQLTSRDPNNHFGSFTIDQGTISGISPHDPVITADGLVGYISKASPTYSVVTTILDPSVNVGAYDRRTSDAGIVQGDITYSLKGYSILTLLPRDITIAGGDYIVTSSVGGVYPDNIAIGTVTSLEQDPHDISMVGIIKPSADIYGLKKVMVITSFTGQGNTGGLTSGGQ